MKQEEHRCIFKDELRKGPFGAFSPGLLPKANRGGLRFSSTKKMAVLAVGGKPAITHYRVTRRFGHHTQVAVRLETGRTHQIRVHMAFIRHPVFGDPVYGGRSKTEGPLIATVRQALKAAGRQMLHAWRLGITHPTTGEALVFEAPLPEDFRGLLEALRRQKNGD